MKTHKLLTSSLLLLCLVSSNAVLTSCNDNDTTIVGSFEYRKIHNKEEYKIIGLGTVADSIVTIPSSHNGLPVTEIGQLAFSGSKHLMSLTIPESITYIEDGAFTGCDRLVEVINKSTHITIEEDKFLSVYNSNNFASKSNFTKNSVFTVFTYKNEKILMEYTGKEKVVFLPTYITKIYNYAFFDCGHITDITIGNRVTAIGAYAFSKCYALKNITFEDCSTWYHTSYYYTGYDVFQNNPIDGTQIDVSDSSKNANFIRTSAYFYKK